MPNHARIQINHTVQANVQRTFHRHTTKDPSVIKLISKRAFRDLFLARPPALSRRASAGYLRDPDLFWDHLFGHIDSVHRGENKKASFLTEESAAMILQNYEKFVSGFDFYNRPRGFLMAKNPHTGIVEVLHYSSFLHNLQKEIPPNHLAISFDGPVSDREDSSHPFGGHQKSWYEALQQKRRLDDGQVICSEQELRSAFIRFSQTLDELGLSFYAPQFANEFRNKAVNPVVLLARWEAVLRNRHLKSTDRKTQWAVMLDLRLENGDEAIRALSDHENDANPCGILLPEMRFVKGEFGAGFRSIIDPKEIQNIKDFWRYIAFQPCRHSVQFYQEALQAIQNITLISDQSKLHLMQMLAGGSTRFNAARDANEETNMLTIWKEVCSIVNRWETMNPMLNMFQIIIPEERKRYMRNDLVHHLCRLQEPPNIIWLNMMFGYIKHYFSQMVVDDGPLVELSDNLNYAVSWLKMSMYKGCKFLCNKVTWVTHDIKEYVELQKYLCDTAGPLHLLLSAHLSTFNISITNAELYKQDIARLRFPNQTLLIFTLKILEDIQTNQGLEWQHLYRICDEICQNRLRNEMDVLDYLERNFVRVFPKNYFPEKKQQVIQATTGLNAEQIEFIDNLNFTPEQSISVKQILSATKANIPLLEAGELQNLTMKFHDFTQAFTSSDVNNFCKHLASMASSLTNLDEIKDFLDLLMKERKFTEFEQMYCRNAIIKNSQNLLGKFSYYIRFSHQLSERYSELDKAAVQTMLATCILNFTENNHGDRLEEMLFDVASVIRDNPHIQEYVFLCLQNIPGNNTPNFIANTLRFVQTLKDMHRILSSADGRQNVQNMQIFYTLLAKYAKSPQDCVTLFTTLLEARFDPAKLKFIVHLISRLLEQNQSLASIQTTVAYIISLREEQYTQFVACYQHPPYAPIQTWQEWAQDPATLLTKYADFSLTPFGPRKLEYAFDLNHYHTQKSLFNGLIRNNEPFSQDLFTDELGQRLNKTLAENRRKSISILQQTYHTARAANDTVTMLCAAIELLARTTPQTDLTSNMQISQEMNTTQVMACYAALVHPNNKLQIEMDTGEGKSRTLMTMATGIGAADFITADLSLAERDYFTYKSFFTSLNIPTSLITLATPELLYQHRGINFSDNEQLQLARNKSDIDGRPFAFLNPDPKQRCLLLDEVDKFKKDKSKYACNYAAQSIKFGGFTWIYPHLVHFMQQRGSHSTQVLSSAEYQALTDDFLRYLATHDADPMRTAQLYALHRIHSQQVATWLHSADIAIKEMHLNDDYAITEQLFPITDGEGNIRMSQKVLVLNHGRPAEGATFSNGLHQCVVALLNMQVGREQYVIPPEVETQRTSYPNTFLGKYNEGKIIGASGTTRSSGPIADPIINHENYGYLLVPRECPLQRENKNIWAAKDQAQQIQFIKRALKEKLAKGLPALVVCKDDNQSLALYQAISQDPELAAHFTRVHSLSTPEEEKTAIRQAGQPGHITFSTAGMFSRGVDIEADDLLVIAAYVPTLEDEIQIMGRTARAGKPGEYRMIPDLSDRDAHLDGNTYNIYNEIDKYQKRLAVEAEFQENVSVMYGLFLEDITQAFLQTRPEAEQMEMWLVKWQDYLNDMQKNWESKSETLLLQLEKNNKSVFMNEFQTFTQTWRNQLQAIFPQVTALDTDRLRDKADKIFDSAVHQVTFFQPKRQPIKVQHAYDPSDDGQARIYDTLFAQTRACLRGERRWFADYYAWREGRGVLFPNLMATLKGERPLFADLIATIKRWLKELKELYQNYFSDEPREMDLREERRLVPVH